MSDKQIPIHFTTTAETTDDDLNALIVTADAQAGVSTGYTLTEADFSAFPGY